MANETNKPSRLTWWLLVIGFLGIAGYCLKSSDVFPSASIDLKKSHSQILELNDQWADRLGYKSKGAIKATVFSYDDDGKTFLEHQLGLSEANALMKETIPIWYWSSRLCRPLNLEEFTTAISPAGKLLSFDHSIENDLKLPSISHDEARAMARQFVENTINLSLADYKSVEDGSVKQANRTDHYFTWQEEKRDFKGAHLRIYVYVSGNTITSFNHFLYIPESWIRKFSEMRSYNRLLEEIASIFYVIFNVATFFAFMLMFARGAIRWKLALIVGGIIGVMDYLESLNSMPNTIRNYTTTMSYNGFVLDIYVSALWSALGQFLQTLMLVGAAESLYRLAYPHKVALENIFSTVGLRCRQVVSGLVAGHAMFGIHLGWIILYYLLGQPLHFWSPLEVRNVESLSEVVPAFSAMYIGATAAVFEELTYRVLGMSIFQKLVKHFWLANLLQAAAWAFMHSNYPQEPAYARGVELTAVGLLYGFVLRRYGLLPCVVSHFVFDAFLSVTPLLSSSLIGLQLTSIVAFCPFLVLLLVGVNFIRKKGWQEDEPLLNSAIAATTQTQAVEEIFPPTPYHYQPLSPSWRICLALVAVLSALIEFGYSFPVIGQQAKLSISRNLAVERARLYMVDRKVPPLARMESARLARGMSDQEGLELQYLFEHVGFKRTAELAVMPGHPLVWHIRFFKPLDPEEYLMKLDSEGKALAIDITRSEDAPGAQLTEDEARQRAERYLTLEHPELNPFQFDSVRREDRKARSDYIFTFKAPKFDAPGAEFKVNVRLMGDQISGYGQYWDLPEKWIFDRKSLGNSPRQQFCRYLVGVIALGVLVAIIWWIVGVVRSGAIHWRPPIMLGLGMSLLVIPQALNDLSEFYMSYRTDTPLLSYFVSQCVPQVMTAVQMIAMAVGLGAFALASFRLLFPRVTVPGIMRAGFTRSPADGGAEQLNFWIDAVLSGYAAGLSSRALLVLLAALHAKISPVATLAPLESLCGFANVLSPALDSVMDALTRGVQSVLVAAIVAGIYAKYFRNFRVYLLFSILISLIYPSTTIYWQDYIIESINYIVYFLATWLFLMKVGRQNILAYFLAGATSLMASSLRVLVNHGSAQFQEDIVILLIVLLSPLLYLLYLYTRRSKVKQSAEDKAQP